MLRRLLSLFVAITLGAIVMCSESSTSEANPCGRAKSNARAVGPGDIEAGITCGPVPSQGPERGSDPPAGDTPCYRSDGKEVACWSGTMWWNAALDQYCNEIHMAPEDPRWDGHRDGLGNPTGTMYHCSYGASHPDDVILWLPTVPTTPRVPGSDPEGAVRTAIATLQLHPPTVGVGAYVYRGYEEWGLGWWVGAPMWLWIDSTDPLQWGVHTLTASIGSASITATIKATQVQFDPGDGGKPVICKTPGTPRPFKRDDPLDRHSPTNCEYVYPHTNVLGDKNSRYEVTAAVTWDVTWSATDGQSGTFTMTMVSAESPSIHVGELRVVRVPDPVPTSRVPTPTPTGGR